MASEPDLDFFVSCATADEEWAKWISRGLEAAGYSILVQAADFAPGSNFGARMQVGATRARHTLLVLSEASLASAFVEAEWIAAFAGDPLGLRHKLIPVKIEACEPAGLLRAVVHIDLTGCTSEDAALDCLLRGVKHARGELSRTDLLSGAFPVKGPPTATTARSGSITNVPTPLPHFADREDELDRIATALEESPADLLRVVTVHGLGGVGKSRLCVEYIRRHRDEYELIWWMRAEDERSVISDLAEMALRLGLVQGGEQSLDGLAARARSFLANGPGWLLVFDNAPGPQFVRAQLPSMPWGHVLVTSTFGGDWSVLGEDVALTTLPRDDAGHYVLDRTSDTDVAAAERAAGALGDLPLALEQAAAYINSTKISIASYITLFDQQSLELFEAHRPLDYSETVRTTWLIAFKRVKQSIEGQLIVGLCAYAAPDRIPRRLFDNLFAVIGTELASSGFINGGIEAGLEFSLIAADAVYLSMHLLVQSAARLTYEPENANQLARIMEQLVLRGFPVEEKTRQATSNAAELVPHALTVIQHVIDLDAVSDATTALLYALGDFFLWQRLFDDAQQALELGARLQAELEPPGTRLAGFHNLLGLVAKDRGRYGDAEESIQRAIDIVTASGEDASEVRTMFFTNLAVAQWRAGKAGEARKHLEEAMAWSERAFGTSSHHLVGPLVSLANATLDPEEAYRLLVRALKIAEQQRQPDPHDLATIRANLANVSRGSGDLARSVDDARRAVTTAEDAYGRDHPRLAALLDALAQRLAMKGDLDEALAVGERAVHIQRSYDPDDTQLAELLITVSELRLRLGDPARALEAIRDAHHIAERREPGGIVALRALSVQGDLEREVGDLERAERSLQLVLDHREDLPASEVAMTLTRLAIVRRWQRRPLEAVVLYEEAIELLRPLGHSDALMNALSNLGNALGDRGRFDSAVDVLGEARGLAVTLYGARHPRAWSVAVNLAIALMNVGDETSAREVLADAQGVDPDDVQISIRHDAE